MRQSPANSKERLSPGAIKLAQRLHQQPQLQARVEELLAVVENAQGDSRHGDTGLIIMAIAPNQGQLAPAEIV